MKAYQAKCGVTQFKPSQEALEAAIADDGSMGFCLACGAEAYGVEPDARKYHCEACKAPKVYGAEELMLMGLFH